MQLINATDLLDHTRESQGEIVATPMSDALHGERRPADVLARRHRNRRQPEQARQHGESVGGAHRERIVDARPEVERHARDRRHQANGVFRHGFAELPGESRDHGPGPCDRIGRVALAQHFGAEQYPQLHLRTETAIARATSTQNSHRRIQAAAVRQMVGDISDMTQWRYLNNPELDFPRPIFIGRRRFWKEADVIAWLEAREAA